ncbi:putative NADH-dependent butanol dehydrogenase 1 [Clostridia bacterium]|nr:putative NADH-dependent butanol dehydrogenase 1 [Clostridia bacterium]
MNNFTFYSPTHFEFGKDTESKTGGLIRKFGGTKVLFVYGGGSIKKSGLYGEIVTSLGASGLPFNELSGVSANPRDTLVYEGIEIVRSTGIDFILAVGGGSVIDTAKAIASGSLYDGDFWDFFCGKAKPEKALPVGTVLTISAAGSEGSPDAVVVKTTGLAPGETPKKAGHSGDCLRPKFSVLNPALTFTLPAYQTAAGAADIIQHVAERYFSNTENCEITDRMCESVILTMLSEAPKAIANPADYDARANIMWAGTVAHTNICGVGRVQDWACHGLEHEISARYDSAHGAGLSVLFPHWLEYAGNRNPHKAVLFAERIFGVKTGGNAPAAISEAFARLRAFYGSIGLPGSLSELGVKAEDLDTFADRVLARKGGSLGNYVTFGKDDILAIYKAAL